MKSNRDVYKPGAFELNPEKENYIETGWGRDLYEIVAHWWGTGGGRER